MTISIKTLLCAKRRPAKVGSQVSQIAESSSSTTGVNNDRGDITWKGKDPSLSDYFGQVNVSMDYGKTVGWQFVDGRDFDRRFTSDSSSIVLNQAAVKYMGLKNPVGELVQVGKKVDDGYRRDKKYGDGIALRPG